MRFASSYYYFKCAGDLPERRDAHNSRYSLEEFFHSQHGLGLEPLLSGLESVSTLPGPCQGTTVPRTGSASWELEWGPGLLDGQQN